SAQVAGSKASPRAAEAKPWFWPIMWARSCERSQPAQGVGAPSWFARTRSTIAVAVAMVRR
ncbi:hypothetical protein ADL26_08090, partial [Thermoactinomyces vulgaris]